MAADAEWSELPKELLNLISERIDNEIDLIHFRSVCSSWRSSSIPNHRINTLPFKLPLLSYYGDNKVSDPLCSLSKRNIFLIKPPPQQDQTLVRPWLIRVTQNSSEKTKRCKSPLFKFELPSLFPLSIDLINTSVLNLGTDFIVDEPLHYGYMYPTKVVAVTPLILAVLLKNGHLALLRCGDERWTVVPEIPLFIEDICVFKGQIYVVKALTSKTVAVGPADLSVRLVAEDVPRGVQDIRGVHEMQFLVESEGELLLVDVYESLFCFEFIPIYVFRLDEKEKEWVELTSLGDRILFWRKGCSFSASASDLSVAKGNCVLFMDDVFNGHKICDSGMCVFDLDRGRLLPLSDYPDYFNMFWPPPMSIVKSCIPKTKKRAKERKRT